MKLTDYASACPGQVDVFATLHKPPRESEKGHRMFYDVPFGTLWILTASNPPVRKTNTEYMSDKGLNNEAVS